MTQAYQSYSTFSTDLSNFVKIIKQREDNHVSLVEYIRKMSEPELSGYVLLDEELRQHQRFSENLSTKQSTLQETYKLLQHKWRENSCLDLEGIKLLRKSLTRVLEIFNSSIQKIRFHKELYEYQYRLFRQSFMKLETDNNLLVLVQLISSYSQEKFIEDQNLLIRLIQNIQNGQNETMFEVIKGRYQAIKNKIQNEKGRLRRIKQEQIRNRKQRQKQKEQQKIKIEEKLRLAQERQKILNKNKKRVTKFTDNVLTKLYSPLTEFSKAQFAADMLFVDQKEQREKLFNEMKEKNKLVQSEINNFVDYSRSMDNKIKVFSYKTNKGKQQQILTQIQVIQQSSNSSPKLNQKYRIASSSKHHSSNSNIDINYQSIQTVSELPPIKQIKQKTAITVKIGESTQYNPNPIPSSTNQLVQKHMVFMKSVQSHKAQGQRYQHFPPKQLSIFDSIKFPTQRKQSAYGEPLPHLKVVERVSLDINKAKLALQNRNLYKITHSNNIKVPRRSDTPQMLIPLIQLNIFNPTCKPSKDQYSQPSSGIKKSVN